MQGERSSNLGCGIDSRGAPRPSLIRYVTVTGATSEQVPPFLSLLY
jgi:hypothetical protein